MPQCQFPVFAVFVFQKSYTGNILRIGQNKSQNSYFSRSVTESKAETEGSQEAATPCHGMASPPGRVGLWCGPLTHTLMPPFCLYIPPRRENLKPRSISMKHTASRRHRRREIGGSRSSSRHPAGEGNHRRRPSSSCLPSE
jgi:hypothetical protein